MFRKVFKKRILSTKEPTPEATWYKQQQDFDTVVFVHGILACNKTTWGKFPELLDSDGDLPSLDILCWGYKSGLKPAYYRGLDTESAALISDLETLINSQNHIYLVGHSMGGLVILKGLVEQIRKRYGRKHPIASIQCVALYASPLLGSSIANAVNYALNTNFLTRLACKILPSKQLKILKKGEFLDSLMTDISSMVYKPQPGSQFMDKAIPIRTCYGKQDRIVSSESAIGIFKNSPSPKPLEGDHSTVKQPHHHHDMRYLVLKKDIENDLAGKFRTICQAATDPSSNQLARRIAFERFDRQYGHMMDECVKVCSMGKKITEQFKLDVLTIVCQSAQQAKKPPAKVFSEVAIFFLYQSH